MTNDKTVTMSRELVEAACRELDRADGPGPRNRAQDFRAALASPVVEPQCSEQLRTQAPVIERQPYGYWICPKGNPKLGSFHHEVLDTTEQYCEVTPLFASPPAPVAVPDGWKLVPIEPTEAMLNVLHDRVLISVNSRKQEANILNDKAWWKAVVESAPACLDKVKELNQ